MGGLLVHRPGRMSPPKYYDGKADFVYPDKSERLTLKEVPFESALFLGPALDDGAQAEAEDVELGGAGGQGWQLPVGVAVVRDQLLANFRGRQATIQAGRLEGGVGLEMVLHQAAEIIEELRQMELDGLAPAQAEGIRAGEAGARLVAGL